MVASLAIPAILLAVILTHDSSTSGSATSTTTVGDPIDEHKARTGTLAPEFTRPTAAGGTLRLSSLRGRPVVIAFFASWCHPCEEELPVLEQFVHDERGRLTVIGVSYRDLNSDSVAFVQRLHVTFPALIDTPDAPVAQRYGVRAIPQTIFVDGRGIVQGRVYGETSHRALKPAIDDLLAGRPVRPI